MQTKKFIRKAIKCYKNIQIKAYDITKLTAKFKIAKLFKTIASFGQLS